MPRLASLRFILIVLVASLAAEPPAPSFAAEKVSDWRVEKWGRKGYVPDPERLKQQGDAVAFDSARTKLARVTRVFDVDLSRTPVIEIVTGDSSCQWRLTGQAEGGPEIVLADYQVQGVCRRNVAKRLAAQGRRRVTIRIGMWGWSGPDTQRLALKRVAFTPAQPERGASTLSGLMLKRHRDVMARAKTMRPVRKEHPSLRFRKSQCAELRRKARTTSRVFVAPILNVIDNLAAEKRKPSSVPQVLGPPFKWGNGMLQVAPREVSPPGPGQGCKPFGGTRTERMWRPLCWHQFSYWVIGDALTDDPAFADQAKRWVLAMARWRFWLRPEYVYFDFGTAYPLQNFAFGYDIAYPRMTEAERAEVREAMASLARGLYLNTLSGHGSIYNDLRGNHTAVTQCGLGLAGLVLLDEHPEAARWAALAEQFMVNAFDEHTSGAWTESPSYGNYGVDEWLKLAEALRNVAGHDHLRHPFLKRYGDFGLMISDWEGRNLGYNQGGCASRWNHWIFWFIAKEWRSAEIQWLANFAIEKGKDSFLGYGDAFWWADPTLKAKRPAARNVGAHYADVGVSVWRSGWEDKATILLHQCGRKGQHKEENMNHFTLYARGQRLLPDGVGTRTRDHNVPVVNGRKQNKWGAGATRAFHTDARSGYVFGDTTSRGSILRRLLYLRPGALAVVDDVRLRPRREAKIEVLLHPNGKTQAVGKTLRVDSGDVRMLATSSDTQGGALPVTVTPRKAGKRKSRATHDVVMTRKGRGPTRTITFLRFADASAMPGATLQSQGREGAVDFACGGEVHRLGTKPGEIAPGCRTNAPLWLARIEKGRVASVLAVTDAKKPVWIEAAGKRVEGKGAVSWGAEAR